MLRRPLHAAAAVLLGFTALAAAADPPLPAGAVRLFGTTRYRTGTALLAVADGGRTIVTLSPTGVVRWFDAETGELRRERLLPLPESIQQLQGHWLSADGSVAVLKLDRGAGTGSEAIAWTTADGRQVWRRANPGETLGQVTLSADGGRIAVLAYNGQHIVQVSDVRTGQRWTMPSIDLVTEVRLTPDGKRVLVGAAATVRASDSRTWTCFEVESGRRLWDGVKAGHRLTLSADGALAFVDPGNPQGNGLIVLDTATGRPADGVTVPPDTNYRIWPPTVAQTASMVLLQWPNEGRSALWDYRAGKPSSNLLFELGGLTGDWDRAPYTAFSPDGRFLYSTLAGRLQRWDTTTGQPTYPATDGDGPTKPVAGLKFSTDGRDLIAISFDQRFFRWDAATGQRLDFGRSPPDGPISRVDGQRAIVRIGERIVTFERLAQPAHVRPELLPPEPPPGLFQPARVLWDSRVTAAPTADGRSVLHLTDNATRMNPRFTLTVNRMDEPEKIRSTVTLPWSRFVTRHPFSPCGRWVVIDDTVYHTETGQTACKPTAIVPDVPARVPLGEGTLGFGTVQVCFSPDGRFLAGTLAAPKPGLGSRTETVAVWELASGQAFPTLLNTADDHLTVSPGGRTVVRAAFHGLVVHDLFTGTSTVLPRRTERDPHQLRNQSVAFAPDGRSFVTGHEDGTVLQWNVPGADGPEPTAADHDALWAALADADLLKARGAVERLVRHPPVAVALLRAKFVPPAAPNLEDLPALVRDLDAANFAVREAASKKLRELDDAAEPALRAALTASTSPEVRQRLEALLALSASAWRLPLGGDLLRGVRAIEVLERVGTAEAKELLAAWRAQTRHPRLSTEADLALGRLR
jgi:WD40 repeat protein